MSAWISVKDNLPEEIFWCIVLTINSCKTVFAFMAIYSKAKGEWIYFDDDKEYEKTMTVTHWMPLPEFPNE